MQPVFLLSVGRDICNRVKGNKTLRGLFEFHVKKLLGQFADDMDLYLFGEQENIDEAFKIIERFGNNSSFRISYDKTILYRLGSLRKSKAQLYMKQAIQETSKATNILGVFVCNRNEDLQ